MNFEDKTNEERGHSPILTDLRIMLNIQLASYLQRIESVEYVKNQRCIEGCVIRGMRDKIETLS